MQISPTSSHFNYTNHLSTKISARQKVKVKDKYKIALFFFNNSKSSIHCTTHILQQWEKKSDLFPNGTLSLIHDRNWLKMIPWLGGYFILLLIFISQKRWNQFSLSLPFFIYLFSSSIPQESNSSSSSFQFLKFVLMCSNLSFSWAKTLQPWL